MIKRRQSSQLTPTQLEHRAELGRWLKERREALGLRQMDVAKSVGSVYNTFISHLELGEGRIPPERYEEWRACLKVDRKEFGLRMLKAYEPDGYRMFFDD